MAGAIGGPLSFLETPGFKNPPILDPPKLGFLVSLFNFLRNPLKKTRGDPCKGIFTLENSNFYGLRDPPLKKGWPSKTPNMGGLSLPPGPVFLPVIFCQKGSISHKVNSSFGENWFFQEIEIVGGPKNLSQFLFPQTTPAPRAALFREKATPGGLFR